MASAKLTFSKDHLSRTGAFIAAWSGGSVTIPAALMAGDTDGAAVSVTITSSNSRSGNIVISLVTSGGDDLTGTMEAKGTVDFVYGDRSFRFLLSAAGQGETVFGDTASPYSWSLVGVSELDIHNRARWLLEAMDADGVAGTYQHDLVITMWDGEGNSPFPAEPAIVYEAEQTFNTAGGAEFNINSARWAIQPATPYPAFDAAFKPNTDDKFLEQFIMRKDRNGIILFVAGDANAARTNTPAEPLSNAFLERGEVEVTLGGRSVVLPMGGPDVFDPRNVDEAPDTTEFYRVDYRGLTAIRYEAWRVRVQNVTQPWQGIFRIRQAAGTVDPAGSFHHHGKIQVTGAYRGSKPLKIYSGSKLVANYRP